MRPMKHAGSSAWAFVLLAGMFLSGDLDAGSLEPPGPPAPTMKTIQQVEPRVAIEALPFTISQAGSYYLTRNLTGVAGQHGITITASDVSLDLDGFALIGVAGSQNGIQAQTAGQVHLAIRNGVIRNWGGSGILASTALQSVVEDMRLASNGQDGLNVGQRSIVRHAIASGNGGLGIQTGDFSLIEGCTASGNAAGIASRFNSVISGTTVSGNTSDGFVLQAGSIATDCTAQQNNVGFDMFPGAKLVHSVARSNVLGIFGDTGGSIEDCTAELNSNDGMRINTRVIVRGNVSRGNTGDGIEVGGSQNRIEDNLVSGNSGVGISVLGASNLIVKNSAGSSTAGEYSFAGGNQVGAISTTPSTAGAWANFDQ